MMTRLFHDDPFWFIHTNRTTGLNMKTLKTRLSKLMLDSHLNTTTEPCNPINQSEYTNLSAVKATHSDDPMNPENCKSNRRTLGKK